MFIDIHEIIGNTNLKRNTVDELQNIVNSILSETSFCKVEFTIWYEFDKQLYAEILAYLATIELDIIIYRDMYSIIISCSTSFNIE